mmetsp:Transcript_82242/g.266289  ORF Transcript_82242/g.266289 Transcript_82242/m.266289 type:complete len:326 (-) Transcript_82242:223-1200(-)
MQDEPLQLWERLRAGADLLQALVVYLRALREIQKDVLQLRRTSKRVLEGEQRLRRNPGAAVEVQVQTPHVFLRQQGGAEGHKATIVDLRRAAHIEEEFLERGHRRECAENVLEAAGRRARGEAAEVDSHDPARSGARQAWHELVQAIVREHQASVEIQVQTREERKLWLLLLLRLGRRLPAGPAAVLLAVEGVLARPRTRPVHVGRCLLSSPLTLKLGVGRRLPLLGRLPRSVPQELPDCRQPVVANFGAHREIQKQIRQVQMVRQHRRHGLQGTAGKLCTHVAAHAERHQACLLLQPVQQNLHAIIRRLRRSRQFDLQRGQVIW